MSFSADIERMVRGEEPTSVRPPTRGGISPLAQIAASTRGEAAAIPPIVRNGAYGTAAGAVAGLGGYLFLDDLVGGGGVHGWLAEMIALVSPWAPGLIVIGLLTLLITGVLTAGFQRAEGELVGNAVLVGIGSTLIGSLPMALGVVAFLAFWALVIAIVVGMIVAFFAAMFE